MNAQAVLTTEQVTALFAAHYSDLGGVTGCQVRLALVAVSS